MSVLILLNQTIGPFKSIEVKEDRLTCDGVDYPFVVIGDYSISEDDSLAPPPQIAPAIKNVPVQISRRQGRQALLRSDLLDDIENLILSIQDPFARRSAQIDYEHPTWERDNASLNTLWSMTGRSQGELDDLFILAETL